MLAQILAVTALSAQRRQRALAYSFNVRVRCVPTVSACPFTLSVKTHEARALVRQVCQVNFPKLHFLHFFSMLSSGCRLKPGCATHAEPASAFCVPGVCAVGSWTALASLTPSRRLYHLRPRTQRQHLQITRSSYLAWQTCQQESAARVLGDKKTAFETG